MTNPKVTIAAFADELTYNAAEHAEFFGKRNMPISTRWFSFDDATKAETFWKLPPEEAKALSVRLKQEGKLKHVCTATEDELRQYKDILDENGAKVWDIGSMLGKQFLGDPASMAVVPELTDRIIAACRMLGTNKVRAFNFYPGYDAKSLAMPGTIAYEEDIQKAKEEVAKYASAFSSRGILTLLEVEANLIGRNGDALVSFYELANPNGDLKLLMYFDGGNMVIQDDDREGLSLNTYISMAPYLGGMHIKDCIYKGGKVVWPFVDPEKVDMATGQLKEGTRSGTVDEEAKHLFVAVGEGNADYHTIFQDFRLRIPVIGKRLADMGMAPEVCVVEEPHEFYGGPLGGFTGPKYPGAIDSLGHMLSGVGIDHQQMYRDADVRKIIEGE